jgi:hypothetical protein
VKTRLRGELERRELPTAEDNARRESGRDLASALLQLDWKAQCDAIASSVSGEIASSRKALEDMPPELHEIVRLFIGHEEALLGFSTEGGNEEHVEEFLAQTHATEEPPIPEGVQLMGRGSPLQTREPAQLFSDFIAAIISSAALPGTE